MTENDWAAYAILFGDEAMRRTRAEYNVKLARARAQAQREHRQRIAFAVVAYTLSAVIAVGGIHGFILLMIAAFDGVTGTP